MGSLRECPQTQTGGVMRAYRGTVWLLFALTLLWGLIAQAYDLSLALHVGGFVVITVGVVSTAFHYGLRP